jgi:hypothetical protein
LQARKLLILGKARTAENGRNAEVRYTAGTRRPPCESGKDDTMDNETKWGPFVGAAKHVAMDEVFVLNAEGEPYLVVCPKCGSASVQSVVR